MTISLIFHTVLLWKLIISCFAPLMVGILWLEVRMAAAISVLSKVPGLLKELAKALPTVNFHEVTSPENDPFFKQSEIIICDFDLVAPHMYALDNVKWIQGTWAGVDKLLPHVRNNQTLPFTITRFTGSHFGQIMSEYVIANIVNLERNFFGIKDNQRDSDWATEGKISKYRTIYDLTIGILGKGNIGNRLGKTLSFMGAEILAFGRSGDLQKSEDYTHIKQYFTVETLPDFLKQCDYVVNVLPNTEGTKGLLNGDVLENCQERSSVFINIGRGSIISENELVKALNNKWISAAVLDVFEPEPLAKSSPLWKMDQVFVTPHVAGASRAKDIAEQFRDNLDKYRSNVTLPAVVDFSKGY